MWTEIDLIFSHYNIWGVPSCGQEWALFYIVQGDAMGIQRWSIRLFCLQRTTGCSRWR